MGFKKEYVKVFMDNQEQILGKRVVETEREAQELLEDCMAVVLPNLKKVREYFEENGMDTVGMSDEELKDSAEVFELPDGKFLVVEA